TTVTTTSSVTVFWNARTNWSSSCQGAPALLAPGQGGRSSPYEVFSGRKPDPPHEGEEDTARRFRRGRGDEVAHPHPRIEAGRGVLAEEGEAFAAQSPQSLVDFGLLDEGVKAGDVEAFGPCRALARTGLLIGGSGGGVVREP
ncbi:hypothetical protein ACWD3D_33250, partial [Streptomyces sp. NPDC002690]